MSPIFLATYVLIWPVIVAGTLMVIIRGFVKEAIEAKREGDPII